MKHVLLTGATGFLGSHLLEALLRQGDQVTILKRSTSDTWRIKHLLEQVTAFDVDVQPLEDAFKARRVDAVIHTACSYGRKGEPPHSVVDTNLLFGLRLLDAAISFNTATFINTDTFFNTGSVLPKYLNSYTLSKKHFVEWLKQSSTRIRIINLKLQHMYGPKDDQTKFVPWVISQLEKGVKRIPLTDGTQFRDFIYIDDVVSAYLLMVETEALPDGFTEFDVGTANIVSVRRFVGELHEAFKLQNPDLHTVLGFGDIPLGTGELTEVQVDNLTLKKLGWNPKYSIDQSIKKMLISDKQNSSRR